MLSGCVLPLKNNAKDHYEIPIWIRGDSLLNS